MSEVVEVDSFKLVVENLYNFVLGKFGKTKRDVFHF